MALHKLTIYKLKKKQIIIYLSEIYNKCAVPEKKNGQAHKLLPIDHTTFGQLTIHLQKVPNHNQNHAALSERRHAKEEFTKHRICGVSKSITIQSYCLCHFYNQCATVSLKFF